MNFLEFKAMPVNEAIRALLRADVQAKLHQDEPDDTPTHIAVQSHWSANKGTYYLPLHFDQVLFDTVDRDIVNLLIQKLASPYGKF